MKKLVFWVCITASTLIMVGCTSSPSKQGEPVTSPVHTQFTPSEKKAYELALTHIKTGELEKAERSLVKLGQAHAGDLAVWINLTAVYYYNNKLDQASTTLSQARKINPDIADIHNLAGLIAVERGEYKEAEKSYLAALMLDKSHSKAHYNLALIYDIFYQDLAKAIIHYEHYLKLNPQEDKDTLSWVEELKLSLKRRHKE